MYIYTYICIIQIYGIYKYILSQWGTLPKKGTFFPWVRAARTRQNSLKIRLLLALARNLRKKVLSSATRWVRILYICCICRYIYLLTYIHYITLHYIALHYIHTYTYMCICIHICYTCINIYIHVHTYTYIYGTIYTYIHLYICIYIHVYIYVYIHVQIYHICVCVRMHICIHIYIYVYPHVYLRFCMYTCVYVIVYIYMYIIYICI